MHHAKAKDVFEKFIRNKDLKHSEQRAGILDVFLKSERHLSADELYRMVKKKYSSIGSATVYRTLKLLCESGICRELKLEDGSSRYEHLYGHEHHDHLICTQCGKFVEIIDQEIERMQERLARANGFTLKRHRLELYGVCKKCRG